MVDDLDETIQKAALAPKKVEGDSGSVEQQPLKDLIEADRYLQSKKAAKRKGWAVKVSKIVPPGTE